MERKYETCIQSNLLEGRAGLFCEPSAWKFQNFLEISNKIDALNFFLNKFFSFIRKWKFEFILRDREILNNRLEREAEEEQVTHHLLLQRLRRQKSM